MITCWSRGHAYQGQAYAGEVAEALFLSAPFSVNRYMHNPIDDRDRAASAVLISAIESSENPDVELMQSLLEAVGDDPHLRPALNVLPYIIDQGWDAQTAVQELQDDDQMIEALLASIELGNSKQAERAESHLSQKADGDVNEMNLRKGRADRFESLEGASATELYATIVYGGRDARESTIKPLFSMLENGIRTSDQTPVEFLDSVDGVGFHEFATLAALHGRFDNFLRLARTAEDKQAITDRLMTFSTDQGAEQVTALSQMILFGKDASVRRLLVDGLADTYADSEKMANPETAAAVTLLSATLGEEATWIEEGDRVEFEKKEFLSSAELVNDRGETIEVQHFYSDLDGEYSYESFLKQFLGSDWKIQEIPSLADATSGGSEEVYMAAGWGIVDHGTFVEVTSTGDGNKMVFYANKPSAAFGEKEGSRFEAWQEAGSPLGMDDVQVHMEANDRSPHIEVHRGHSYWFGNTLDQLSLDTKLVFNGSCGGADEVDDILEKAPGAQVVYNSDEGWAIINDAMLSEINERVVSGGDIVWEDVRMGAEDRLERHQKSGSSRPDLMSKYMSYVYPDQQLGQAANIGSLYEDMIAVL